MIKPPLQILHLEDSDKDAEIIAFTLTKGEIVYNINWVVNKIDFLAALEKGEIDLILSDYNLPNFDGLSALEIARKRSPHIPFIFVSGAIGEETAIETFKLGATDYVLKVNLSRLVPAVHRALKESIYQKQLMESQRTTALLASLVESSFDAILGTTLDGTVTTWNKGAQDIFGYSSHEILGKNVDILLLPDQKEEVNRILMRMMNNERISQYQGRRMTKDGQIINIEATISPIKDAKGVIIGASKIARDITHQKESESRLIESEERFKIILSVTHDLVWDWDLETNHLAWGDGIYSDFGFTKEDATEHMDFWIQNIHADDLERIKKSIHDVIDGTGNSWMGEYRYFRKDRSCAYIFDRGYIIRNPQGKAIRMIGAMMDISERKSFENKLHQTIQELATANDSLKEAHKQLIHSEKMAAIGQLSAGVAHEIKNPLGIITLSIEQLKGEIKDLDENKLMYIKMIEDATERANKVVVGLLGYARTSDLKLEPASVESILEHTVFLLQSASKIKDINIHCLYNKEQPSVVLGDKALLGQVFFNLIANAIDAMGNKGNIYVRTSISSNSEKLSNVIIEIEDTGTGMSPEVVAHIFEPFYTTKLQDKGTGLGLSIVEMILTQHGGTIRVESKVNVGTKFIIAIPKVKEIL